MVFSSLKVVARAALAACVLVIGVSVAVAGKADVVDARLTQSSPGFYTVDVTVKSDDTGWEKYADRWEVLGPDGKVLGTRVLYHPHETEQPFTRSLDGVAIPAGIDTVTIRAHDKVEGWGGREMKIKVPR